MNFSVAFKRMPDKYKKGTFQQILDGFHKWAPHQPMTSKQVRGLAIETHYDKKDKYIKGKSTNIKVISKSKSGKVSIRYKDVYTGEYVRGEYGVSRIPHWRDKEIRKEKGSVINIDTGERYKTRYAKGKHKGQLMKKEKWTYTDRKGKTRLIYPKPKNKKGR